MNNAGGATKAETVDATPEYYSLLMATNFESVYHLSQLAYPLFKASGQGNIVFISSVASIVAVDVGSVYGPAKGTQILKLGLFDFFVWENQLFLPFEDEFGEICPLILSLEVG